MWSAEGLSWEGSILGGLMDLGGMGGWREMYVITMLESVDMMDHSDILLACVLNLLRSIHSSLCESDLYRT